jgi:hypothetical protein
VRRARRHRSPRGALPRRAETRSMEAAMSEQALRISLRNGFCSACPLIPLSWRGWWGAWIRPLPPYVTSWTEQEGSDPVPPRSGGEGSADGRGGDSGGAQNHQGGQHQQHRTTAKRTGGAEDGHRGRAFKRSATNGLR